MERRFAARDVAAATFFAAVGIGAWLHWSITDPSFDQTPAQSEWDRVLGFSALVLAVMGAAALLGWMLSQTAPVRRTVFTLVATGVLAAVTNVVEDGLGIEAAFFLFILLTGIQLLALTGLAIALGVSVTGPRRALAVAPLATALGLMAYVPAGGPILMGTWCAAAVYVLATLDARSA